MAAAFVATIRPTVARRVGTWVITAAACIALSLWATARKARRPSLDGLGPAQAGAGVSPAMLVGAAHRGAASDRVNDLLPGVWLLLWDRVVAGAHFRSGSFPSWESAAGLGAAGAVRAARKLVRG
jgi:hypothetical protein